MNYLLEDMEKWASRYDSDYFTRENLLNEAKESAKVLKDRYKERDVYKTLYEKALKDTQEKSYDAWWDYKKEKDLKAAFESMREEAKKEAWKEAWGETSGDNKSSDSVKAETPPINKPIIDPNIKPTQPNSGGNSSLKPIAIAGAGAAALGGGAYLYHRYKKKKRAQEQEKVAGDSDYNTRRIIDELEKTPGNVRDTIADAKKSAQNVKALYEKKKFLQAKADVLKRRHEINTARTDAVDRLDSMRDWMKGTGSSLRHELRRSDSDPIRLNEWRHQVKVDGQRYKDLYNRDPGAATKANQYYKAYSNSEKKVWEADKELRQNEAQFKGSLFDLKQRSRQIKNIRAENQRDVERTHQNVEAGKKIRERLLEEQDRAKRNAEQQAMFDDWAKKGKELDRKLRKKGDRQTAIALAGTAAALGGGAYLYNRYKKKKREQAEQEKTAAESMPARYKKIDWDNDPTGEKKKIKRKLLASGALTAAGLGVNLHQIALMARDRARNTNHAKPHLSMAGIAGGGAGLLLAEKQLQKAEHLDGLPVGGAANQKKSRFDDWNVVIY